MYLMEIKDGLEWVRNDFSSDPIKQSPWECPTGTYFILGQLQVIASLYVISKSGNYYFGKVIHWIFKKLTFLCHAAESQWSAGGLEMVQLY